MSKFGTHNLIQKGAGANFCFFTQTKTLHPIQFLFIQKNSFAWKQIKSIGIFLRDRKKYEFIHKIFILVSLV